MKLIFAVVRQQLDLARRELACFDESDALIATLPSLSSLRWLRLATRSFIVESIYSGLERILRAIADEIDDRVPSGRDWHAVLLKAMAASGPLGRPPVIGPETFALLDDLRRFRHVTRHHYALELDEQGIEENLAAVRRVLPLFEADMRAFEVAVSREETP